MKSLKYREKKPYDIWIYVFACPYYIPKISLVFGRALFHHLIGLKMVGAVIIDQWCTIWAQQSVQFDFWLKTLSLEILMLLYMLEPFETWCCSLRNIWLRQIQTRAGQFMVHMTDNKCSAIAIDQYDEQQNAIIKRSGGAVGLTGNPPAPGRWMVAGPEVPRIWGWYNEIILKRQRVPSPWTAFWFHQERS